MSWETVLPDLKCWHEARDREAGRRALTFLEPELRLMVPGLVRRTWPQDLIEDALRDFLHKLVNSPLPNNIDNLRSYLSGGLPKTLHYSVQKASPSKGERV